MQASASSSARPTLEEAHEAIRVLGKLTDLFQKRREQLAAGVGLSDQQWGILEQIATEHFMPSLFARERDSSAAAVSKILRQLVEKELVSVSVSKTDGRQRDYVLTPRGKRLMERLRQERQEAIVAVWLELEGTRLRTFTNIGTEIMKRLEEYSERAEHGRKRR